MSGQRITKQVVSLQELRQQKVVRQQWDFTCGAAALATMLRYQHGMEVEEREIVETLLPVSGKSLQAVVDKGFSLLDLKKYAVARGLRVKAYGKLTLEELQEFDRPAIVPVFLFGFHHFVVFRGVRAERAFVADPAVGNTSLPKEQFLSAWQDGIGFFILSQNEELAEHQLAIEDRELLFPDRRRTVTTVGRHDKSQSSRTAAAKVSEVLNRFDTDIGSFTILGGAVPGLSSLSGVQE